MLKREKEPKGKPKSKKASRGWRDRDMEELDEEERRALRASKFAPLPPSSSSRSQEPRLAHPGGPLKTNKAAALAKFLERRLQDPNGLASIDPQLLELAVQNAKNAVCSSSGGTSNSGRVVHHVNSFGDSEESFKEEKLEISTLKKQKKKKKKKKKKNKKEGNQKDKKQKMRNVAGYLKPNRPENKLKS